MTTIWMTFFDDVFATSLRAEDMSLEELAELIANTWAPTKDKQPLLKLARFGSVRSALGSLRHDGNVIAVSGMELDYDREEMPLAEACARFDALGLSYVAYTTASHTPQAPRWRILLLFSKGLSPGERGRMVSRANGVLGGVLSAESWATSTAFFFGNIVGQPPAEIIIGDGDEHIDEHEELDATALPFRAAPKGGPGAKPDLDTLDEHELLELIETGQVYYGAAKRLIEMWADQGITEPDAQANLEAAFDRVPVPDRDAKWTKRRSNIPRWVKQGYAYARKRKGRFFQALVDHIENRPEWRGAVRLNRFTGTVEVPESFPPLIGQLITGYRPLHDPTDILETLIVVQSNGFPTAGKGMVFDALFLAAARHAYHPVRDWLDSLSWDGVSRIHRLFFDYIPARLPERADDLDEKAFQEKYVRFAQYIEAIGSAFPISAVARIYKPGCKVDNMPVLLGPQGLFKSWGLQSLVPNPAWFSDDVPINIGDRDAKAGLDGKWVIELSEFPQLRREIDATKAFFSRQTDRYRLPYARLVADWPRQCVFIATANELEFQDVTGNRRFWPVALETPIDVERIIADREQIWAEAVHWYREGVQWWLPPDLEAIAAEVQDDYVELDVRDELIAEWIARKFPAKDKVTGRAIALANRKIRFTVREVLEGAFGFAVVPKDQEHPTLATGADEKRAIRRLRRLGYRPDPHRPRTPHGRRYWVPGWA